MAASPEFPKKFDLDEEKLRRIVEILKERIPEEDHQKIIFQVNRRDSLIYKTENISTVLDEDNDSTKIINTIVIVYDQDNLKALIAFDADKGCNISIEGEDRDLVFLLASSLKEYIGKEVTIYFKLPFSVKVVPAFIMLALGIYWMYLMYSSLLIETHLSYQEVVKSQNINDKLNYLILKGNSINPPIKELFYGMAITLIVLILTLLPLSKLLGYFCPRNNFLIGKQITVVARKKDINSKIFWCVIVAVIIGVAISYLFSKKIIG